MKRSRVILILIVALAAIAAAVFPLLPPDRTPAPAVPPQKQASAPAPPAPTPPAPPSLDTALRFSAPTECEMAPPLLALVQQMSRIDPETFEATAPGPIAVPGFDRPIVPRFNRTRTVDGNADIREVKVELDLPGLWHGLRVTRLLRHFTEESDASSVEIQFAETPERVRDVLRRAGFPLGAIGEWREIGSDEPQVGMAINVSRIDGGASMACAVG